VRPLSACGSLTALSTCSRETGPCMHEATSCRCCPITKLGLMHEATLVQAGAAAGHHICHAGRREVLRLLRRLPCELPQYTPSCIVQHACLQQALPGHCV
jgi:hypothetical protein